MGVQSKRRIAQSARPLQHSLHQILADLPTAKRRTHVKPLHLAGPFQWEWSQTHTADWLSRYRCQKQRTFRRRIDPGQSREFSLKQWRPVLLCQLGVIFAKQITNLLHLLLAQRFHNVTHTSPAAEIVFLSAHQDAAIDLQHFTRDVSRLLGGEKLHRMRHIEVRTRAPQRNVPHHGLFQFR